MRSCMVPASKRSDRRRRLKGAGRSFTLKRCEIESSSSRASNGEVEVTCAL
jgi:hypothetical protein